MKGSEIIKKLGVTQAHCHVEKEMIEIDPEIDYVIVRGTDMHPRIVCPHHEEMISAGKYIRLKLDGKEVLADVEWTTGHNTFEGDVEPKFSPERDKTYMIQ
jgi:hypothetical protein